MKLLFISLMATALPAPAAAQLAPAADHHQHLFSPTLAALLTPDSVEPKPLTARDVIAVLDSAGIRKAVLLSTAYIFGSPARTVEDEYAKVRAENDWNVAQAAEYPGRLIGFCSFNPLKDYALQELERCARHPGLRRGIKLHLGNADVQLENPSHVAQLGRVFGAANQHRMAIVVHTRHRRAGSAAHPPGRGPANPLWVGCGVRG